MREINNFENEQLTKLRNGLLPMLMNGQVTVSNKSEYEKKPLINQSLEILSTLAKAA